MDVSRVMDEIEDALYDFDLHYQTHQNEIEIVRKELDYAKNCHGFEEEIGCPLDVFMKALKQSNFEGLFIDTVDNDGIKWNGFEKCNLMYDAFNNRFYWCNGSFCVFLYDYKKTWWLKEDRSE